MNQPKKKGKRIYEVAKEYHISSEALISMLRNMGSEVKSHMSVVHEDMLAQIKRKFEEERESSRQEIQRKKIRAEERKSVSEDVQMWTEILFNVAYLLVIWALVVAMWQRRSGVAPENQRVADSIRWAFTLLALGDTGHVGFRVLAYAQGDLEATFSVLGFELGWVGLGALATAITVTGFYVFMLFAWRDRFNKAFGWFEYALVAAAVVRFVIMVFPANAWNSVEPPQPWSTFRNIPLIIIGLGVAYLILRDARATGDRPFLWIGLLIVVSYVCYMPVIFFVQRAPAIGMLMIPKTMAYLGIAWVAYRELFRGERGTAAVAQSVGDD